MVKFDLDQQCVWQIGIFFDVAQVSLHRLTFYSKYAGQAIDTRV
jgi:hypothetical protein